MLHDWHASHGAKMVDFAGWSMPVQYGTGIIAEHLATRRGAGVFDVSHMGRYRVTGPGAESFLLATLTNNASGLDPWQAQYTFIANESGGVVDDAYLYRLADEDFLLVVNAGNRAVDWEWLSRYSARKRRGSRGRKREAGDALASGPGRERRAHAARRRPGVAGEQAQPDLGGRLRGPESHRRPNRLHG